MMVEGMKFYEYRNPEAIGWKGWIEDQVGKVIGFVRLDGSIVNATA